MAGENVASPSSLNAALQTAAANPSAASTQAMPAAFPTAGASTTAQAPGTAVPGHQQHAVNLSQGQAFPQNQQTLNQMSFQQQQQKQSGGARPHHGPYVQNPSQQQAASPAMVVQSPPPSTASISRTSAASRIMQLSQSTGLRAAPGLGSQFGSSMPGTASLQQQQQLQQQQIMLAAQRASQGQAVGTPQQRPSQSGQTAHMQSGQLTSPGIMGGSSAILPNYPSQYMQQQQIARQAMGGQVAGHPSMSSQQLSAIQQMQGRQKQAQVSASQFPAAASAGPQVHLGGVGSISAVGSQLMRPSGSAAQQQPRLQQMQSRQPQQQQQSQQLSQQQPSPQKLQAQQLQKLPSASSLGSGLQPSAQSSGGPGNLQNQPHQPWMQKQMHQVSASQASYHVSQQQGALQKQVQAQYSQQLQGQTQQTQLSQINQQQQLGRVQPSSIQRPPTPTGIQPGTPATGTPTASGSAMNQPLESGNHILGKRSIRDLVAQVDPTERIEPEVEDMLLEIADDFIESVTTFACKLAKHRKSNILEAKDVLLHLNRNWDLSIPGFGGEEYRAYKKTSINETHKQRLALIKKSIATQQGGQDPVAAKASGGGQLVSVTAGSQAPTTS